MYQNFQKHLWLAKLFLRVGLAFVLLYAAVEIYFDPSAFVSYIPDFVTQTLPPTEFLFLFSVAELILVVWILSGWRGKYAAYVAFFLITGIVVFNLDRFPILFRNVAISFGALALAELEGMTVNTTGAP